MLEQNKQLEKPITFYNTPEGKILNHVVHEAVNGTCIINSFIHLHERKKESNSEYKLTEEKLDKFFEVVKKQTKRINDAVDYCYTETKKLKGFS